MLKFVNKIFKRKKVELKDTFTPSSSASLTYIRRDGPDEELKKALDIRGLQMVVYGHSGSGKTTMIQKVLLDQECDFIVTNCTPDMKIDDVITDAFDRLNLFCESQSLTRSSNTFSQDFGLKNQVMNSGFSSSTLIENEKILNRVIPVQITPQRLSEYLGRNKVIWIIEDFHKMGVNERDKLAQILKVFVDTSNKFETLKVIAVGAVGTARELVKYNPELANRLAEIHVPLMKREELRNIILKGERLLNISFEDDVKESIIDVSNNLASICHHLCFSICYKADVKHKKKRRIKFDKHSLNNSILDYLKQNSDSFKEILDKILKHRENQFEYMEGLLKIICKIRKDEFTIKEAFQNRDFRKKLKGQEVQYFKALTTEEYAELLRFDENSGKYSFSNPFVKAYIIMFFKNENEDFLNERNVELIGFSKMLENIREILSEYEQDYFTRGENTLK